MEIDAFHLQNVPIYGPKQQPTSVFDQTVRVPETSPWMETSFRWEQSLWREKQNYEIFRIEIG